ncbi:GNAT family N-acetyltransferase [Kovacikia minuta CCNUW1]|uniref:GNAT family N-acetyltransferase n=1 Tax=Kovacikia minuta TaxID=2931930 RepID=UPI001CCF2F80|nr:GNAT family N-acetyltransferase [Kovacikia minuta]UBF24184.1 GNAT family N-acetyltransferase [Kovacikia minuta CCNUW1]
MPVRYEVPIIRERDDQVVKALLVTLAEKHLHDFEGLWKQRLRSSEQADQFWDWELKHRAYLSSVAYEGYAIECEQITQGLMLIATQGHHSQFEPHRRLVYVHSLASAPWNRPSLQTPVEFRAVGRTLLQFARFRSEELGYEGLVGLHALPGAEGFYRRMGMIDCGADGMKEDLTYFEWYCRRPSLLEELDL